MFISIQKVNMVKYFRLVSIWLSLLTIRLNNYHICLLWWQKSIISTKNYVKLHITVLIMLRCFNIKHHYFYVLTWACYWISLWFNLYYCCVVMVIVMNIFVIQIIVITIKAIYCNTLCNSLYSTNVAVVFASYLIATQHQQDYTNDDNVGF